MGHLTMTDPDDESPRTPGRRALDPDDASVPTSTPRRAVEADDEDIRPRRALFETEVAWEDTPPLWHRPRLWIAAAVGLSVLALLIWTLLPRTATPPSPPSAVPSSSSAVPSTSPTSTRPTSIPPSPSMDGTTTAPPAPVPTVEATTPDASPPVASPPPLEEEPAPTGNPAAGEITLNDAQFTAPDGWSIYADEEIEGDRRAVRLRQDATDARMQAVTLEPGASDLAASCESLVTLQQAQFTEVSRQLVVGMGVDSSLGTAARCGFSGTRTSDGVNNTVTFTLVMRASDSHILLLRHTVPDTVEAKVLGVAQLNAMTCGASTSFGVPIPLC